MANLGVPLIRLKPADKLPIDKSWQYRATTDPDTIRGWFNENAKINYACVAKDNGFLFFETDQPGVIERYEAETGNKMPSTFTVQSRADRFHFYFRQTEASRACGQIEQGEGGISFGSLRQNNAYVVGPLSVHPDTGLPYTIVNDVPIVDIPDALVAWLDAQDASKSPKIGRERKGEAPVEREHSLIPHGQIHAFMLDRAGKMRSAGLDKEEIKPALLRLVKEHCQPPIDEAKVRQMAESICNYKPDDSFVYVGSVPPGMTTADVAAANAVSAAEALWNNPNPDPTARLVEVQKFELDFLPTSVRARVADVAKRTSTPLDFAGIASIVSLAGVTGRRVFVYPRGKDKEWRVAIALSGFIVAASGETKTPVWDAFLAPITENDAQWREAFLNAKKLYEEQMDEWESQRKKRPKAGEQLESKPKPKEPPRQRSSIINNATPEALHSAMEGNPEGYLYYRDELSGFIEELDQEGRESQRDIFMKAMDGNGAYALERIGRGYVSAIMCASMGGNFQPNRLAALLNNTRNIEDGFVPRNTLMVYPERIRKVVVDCPTDLDAKKVFRYIVRELVAMHYNKVEMHFTPEAQAVFDAWLEKHTERTDNETSDWIKSHMSKYNGAVPKLAGLFQLVDIIAAEGADCGYADEGPRRKSAAHDSLVKVRDRHLIELDHLNQALRLLTYLETHMRKIYGTVASPLAKAEAAMVAHIKDGSLTSGFTARDIVRNGWRGLKAQALVDEAIQTLEDTGWIRRTIVKTAGRPRNGWEINPKVQ